MDGKGVMIDLLCDVERLLGIWFWWLEGIAFGSCMFCLK
jgi:hypothetical protein